MPKFRRQDVIWLDPSGSWTCAAFWPLSATQMPLPLRSGRAVRHTHDYKRPGVVDLDAALEVATCKVTHKVTDGHTAIDFLGFVKIDRRAYPIRNCTSFSTTPPPTAPLRFKRGCRITLTSTSATRRRTPLGQPVEGFFGVLGKAIPRNDPLRFQARSTRSPHAFMRSWNLNPTSFAWTKPTAAIIRSHRRRLDRISTAVH